MTDLSTIVLSKTVASSGGTLCWMSPELLDPPRFGSNGCPTRESDCYALGMVVYEVSWVHPVVMVSRLPITGSDWPPTIPPYILPHVRSRRTQRRASRETSRRRIFRILRYTLGVGAIVLERVGFDSADRPAAGGLLFPCISRLDPPSSVPRDCDRYLHHHRFRLFRLLENILREFDVDTDM
jgi:hypothetical protein